MTLHNNVHMPFKANKGLRTITNRLILKNNLNPFYFWGRSRPFSTVRTQHFPYEEIHSCLYFFLQLLYSFHGTSWNVPHGVLFIKHYILDKLHTLLSRKVKLWHIHLEKSENLPSWFSEQCKNYASEISHQLKESLARFLH